MIDEVDLSNNGYILHEIEWQVQVRCEVVKAALEVRTELHRVGLHARALLCLGRFLTTLFDRLAELRDLLLHPIDLRSCR